MKKFLFIALSIGLFMAAVSAPTVSHAQTPKLTIKTITTADTMTFAIVPSMVKSFTYTFIETSGTTAGKVYLEATNDTGGAWKILDSLTLADVTTKQGLFYTPTATSYMAYRFRNTNTSSATGQARGGYLRRTDE